MPFNPNTGVWESGGDHAWTMPSTSAGDIVGGFNSAQAFQQNQEEQRLRMLLQQLTAQQTQYKMGREQEQDTREDDFRAGLQPSVTAGSGMEIAPRINSQGALDDAMLNLYPEKGYEIQTRRDSQQANLRYQQAGKRLAEYRKAVNDGSGDPQELSAKLLEEFPDMPQLAQALGGMKIAPKVAAGTELTQARMGLAKAQTQTIEEMRASTVEGRRLKNDILRLQKAAGGHFSGSGKTGGGDSLSKYRLWLSINKYLSDQTFVDQIKAKDPALYEAALAKMKEIGDSLLSESSPVSAGSGTTAPTAGGMPQGFKQGDKVYDFTKP